MNKMKMMVLAGGMLAAASCSDFDDFNTVPVAADPAADQTLWENISKNPELSDFRAVLERVGYDKVLDAAHTYTVWAPVNGDGSWKEALDNVSDEKVVHEFLNNLIADYAHRENDPNDTVIYMLNEKLLKFTGKNSTSLAFDAQRILPNVENPSVYNYPSTNGLLYVVSSPSVFRYNGYEYIAEMTGRADSMLKYVRHFERITLDEENSVKGDIRDGVQHYDDSVMIVQNKLISETLKSQLDNEDSLYTVLIPTNGAWEEAYNRIASYYKYIETIDYQDLSHSEVTGKGGAKTSIMKAETGKTTVSLTTPPADAAIQTVGAYWNDSITKRLLTYNLIFSENEKKYNVKLAAGAAFAEKDTLVSTTGRPLTNLPELDAVTEEVVKLSNGHARIINKFPFSPEETYAPVIKSRDVGRIVTATGSGASIMTKLNIPDSICVLENEYEKFTYIRTDLPSTSNYAPELDFYLNNVLSTTYDVSLVVVPAWVDSYVPVDERKPYSLLVDINYTDASNKQIAGRFDGETVQTTLANIKKVTPFEVGRDKVDTLKLGRITFPICYANTGAKPNIKVMHSLNLFSSSNKKKYEQVLRIANVILRPVETTEE